MLKIYYTLAVWRLKPLLSVGLRFQSFFCGGLQFKHYCAVAENHNIITCFSVCDDLFFEKVYRRYSKLGLSPS